MMQITSGQDHLKSKLVKSKSLCHERELLTISITEKCDVGCRHCISNCKKNYHDLDLLQLSNWLRGSLLGTFKYVTITGGEPFIDFDRLLQLGKILFENKLEFAILTSACWANCSESVLESLALLSGFGLKSISISLDKYHLEKIPLENYHRLILAASELKLIIAISYCSDIDETQEQSLDYINLCLGYNSFKVDVLTIHEIKLSGRASRLNLSKNRIMSEGCQSFMFSIVPPNLIYGCCGSRSDLNSKMILGRLNDRNFNSSLENYLSNPYRILLESTTFEEIINTLIEIEPAFYYNKTLTGCDLCNYLFNSERNCELIKTTFFEKASFEVLKLKKDVLGWIRGSVDDG